MANISCSSARFRFSRHIILLSLILLVAVPTIGAQEEPAAVDSLDLVLAPDSIPLEYYPLPPTNVTVRDVPNDAGEALIIEWQLSADDIEDGKVLEYILLRSETGTPPFEEIGRVDQRKTSFTDRAAEDGVDFYYQVAAINYEQEDGETIWEAISESAAAGPVAASAQWFHTDRLNIFIGIIILCGSIIYFIMAAKRGKDFYVRKIAGIEEVHNAVGRATEMGRSIYYIPGIQDMDDVQTLASLTILGSVAAIAAENDTRIDVPVSRSMVMVTAKEVVKEAYSKVGRPDSFMDDQVRYLTDDQFGYAAAVDGLFVREKPAAIFLIGAFFAESLIMAETGNSIGAIQISGTAMPSQLPFFIAACDFTLIGEELFAASAYLSREPKLLGSLKGQDVGKAVFLLAILVGCILESFGVPVHELFAGK